MKRYKSILFFMALLNGISVYSQDLTTNYLSYVHNFYNLNPAYCAIGHKFAGVLDVRQRAGLNAVNTMLGVSGMLNDKQGAGGRLVTDVRGPFQVMVLDGTYSYKLGLDQHQSIYFGLSAGLVNKSLNTSKIKNYDQLDADDPVLDGSNFRSTTFTAGAGMIYEYKSFEFAFSAPQLVDGNKKTFSYFNALAANIFYLNSKYEITPMLIYFNTPVVKNLVSMQCRAEYNRRLSLQLGYQSNSMFNACLGFSHSDLGIAYNFMTSNKLMNVQTSGTHEVILTLRMGKKNKNHHLNKIHPEPEHVE
jgi:type IX secretion system PorP/SprF family membrane protein